MAVSAVALLLPGGAGHAEQRVDLPSRPGITETIYLTPATAPVATAILFPGSFGAVSKTRGNFLIRIAPQLAAAGVTAVVADAPSDYSGGMPDIFRASAAQAEDVAAIIAWLKQRSPAPIWLVGTSRGSISAANAGVRLGAPRVAGVVLTSSVWASGMQQTDFATLRVPVLIVHNRDDTCRFSPYAGAQRAMSLLAVAPIKELITVSGGRLSGDPCEAKSPHGYLGIEDQVVTPLAAWIKSH